MRAPPKRGVVAGLHLVATLICEACSSPDDEPCPGCVAGARRAVTLFCEALPPGQTFTPEAMALAIQGSAEAAHG